MTPGREPKTRDCGSGAAMTDRGKNFTKALDFGKICDNMDIKVRSRRPGDTIYLNGMGTKKMKDWFIDKKVPAELRDKAVFVACGKDVITMLDGPCSDKFNPSTKDSKAGKCVYLQIWGSGA
jgi:tRNA(Ile)-lysidine synthase